MTRTMIVGIALSVLVAGEAHARTTRFARSNPDSENPDEYLVTDNVTGLVWQGCVAGRQGSDCATNETTFAAKCTGGTTSDKKCTWKEALAYCENLVWGGHDDWRLPNKTELSSIVDDRQDLSVSGTPAIDQSSFPATPTDYFWSSSSYAANPGNAWSVYFGSGVVEGNAKSNTNDVRCVRGGP